MVLIHGQAKNRSFISKTYKELYSNLLDFHIPAPTGSSSESSLEADNAIATKLLNKNDESSCKWDKMRSNFAKQFKQLFDAEFGVNGVNLDELSESELKEKIARLSVKIQEYSLHSKSGNLGDFSIWLKSFKRSTGKDLDSHVLDRRIN